jgi:two-component system, chemotaxis family, chemotaxis protein CheY
MAKRILAVDDSATMRQLVRITLTRAGYEVVEAEDGAKGLQKATAEAFDMVLSDINMPIMSGLDLLRNLRNRNCRKRPRAKRLEPLAGL